MTLTHLVLAELNGPGTPLVDVTADVDMSTGLAFVWGRSDWLATEPSAGTLTFTLDNRTGNYSPGSPTGLYAVGCAEGVGVVWWVGDTAAAAGTPARLGRALQFKMGTPTIGFPNRSGGSATVTVQCVDLIADLSNSIMRSMFDETVLYTAPAAYWPLTEATGATAGQDASGNSQPALVQASTVQQANMQWAQGGGIPTENTGALYVTAGPQGTPATPFAANLWGLNVLNSASNLSVPVSAVDPVWSVSAWVTAPKLAAMSGGFYAALLDVTMSDGWSVGLLFSRATGEVFVACSLSPSNVYSSGVFLTDGGTHQLMLQVQQVSAGRALTCYLAKDGDRFPVSNAMTGRPLGNRPVRITVGGAPHVTYPTNCMDWTGALHHVALWPNAATSYAGPTIATAGLTGYPDTSFERTERFLSTFDPTLTADTVGTALPTVLETQDVNGQSVLSMIGNALRLEAAQFISRPVYAQPVVGTAVLATRGLSVVQQPVASNPTPSLSVDAETQCVGVPQIAGNLSGRVATATAQGRNGAATYTNPALLAVTTASATVGVASSDPAVLAGVAQNRVAAAADTSPQVTSVTIDLVTSEPPSGGWLAAVLPVLPGDRLRVTNLPAAALGFSVKDSFIAGGSETYSLTQSEVMYVLQPADTPPVGMTYAGSAFMGSDNTSRFGADDCTVQTAVGPSATTITVNANTPFTVVPTEYPLSLNIGGECVTAVTPPVAGAGTLQTFSGVSRGAQGTLPRALRAGAPVDLWLAPCFTL